MHSVIFAQFKVCNSLFSITSRMAVFFYENPPTLKIYIYIYISIYIYLYIYIFLSCKIVSLFFVILLGNVFCCLVNLALREGLSFFGVGALGVPGFIQYNTIRT